MTENQEEEIINGEVFFAEFSNQQRLPKLEHVDTIICNTVLTALGHGARWTLALQLCQDMN